MSHIVFEFKEPEPHKVRRRVTKIALIALAVVGAVFLFLQVSHMIAAAPLTAVADKIQPASDWKKEGEMISGGAFCVNYGVPCDHLSRTYISEDAVTQESIEKVIKDSGLSLSVQGTCDPRMLPNGVESSYTECFAGGVVDGHDVTIKAAQMNENSPTTYVTFSVSNVESRWK